MIQNSREMASSASYFMPRHKQDARVSAALRQLLRTLRRATDQWHFRCEEQQPEALGQDPPAACGAAGERRSASLRVGRLMPKSALNPSLEPV